MTLEEVYKFYGSTEELCKAIGIKRQSVAYWRQKGEVPRRTQAHIEIITRGKLIAQKEPKQIISSIFKYQDKKHGLCEVISIHFTKGIPPKIIYVSPENSEKKFTAFNVKNLIIKKT